MMFPFPSSSSAIATVASATSALCLVILASSVSADSGPVVTKYKFVGYQNVFSLDTKNHGKFDVGNFAQSETVAAKKCANLCSAMDWCGAMYLSYEDNKCHAVPQDETGSDYTAAYAVGPGHVFYYKSQVGPAVPLEADSAFEALIGI